MLKSIVWKRTHNHNHNQIKIIFKKKNEKKRHLHSTPILYYGEVFIIMNIYSWIHPFQNFPTSEYDRLQHLA